MTANSKELNVKPSRESLKVTLHKLWVLVKLQISEKLKWNATDTFSHKAGVFGKHFGGMILAYGVFTGLFYLIFKILAFQPTIDMFIFFIFLLQLISIVVCTVQASHILYTSKDNSLLLTYPVKHFVVFASKLIVMYILELIKSLILTLPLFMAYMTMVPGIINANYIICSILYSIFLPLMPVLIGAIISIPFVFVTKIFKKAVWVKGIFSLGLFALLIYFTIVIVQFIQANSPIRIMALFNKFQNEINAFFQSVNKFGLYANLVGNGMVNSNYANAALNNLAMAGVVVGVLIISVLISLPTFYKLASSASENATQKKHKGKNVAHKSTFVTFLRKEFLLSIRNIGNFASDYVFLFALPFVLSILSAIFINVERNDLGFSMTYGFIGLTTLIMLCASNTASATAISSEGSEFALLKTAPGKISNIIWSKLLINFIISFLATLISFVILNIILIPDIQAERLDPAKLWVVFAYVSLIECGLLLWSIQLDIVNPKLREFANAQNKSEIKNSASSILIGLIFSVIFSALLILLFITKLPLLPIAIILIGVALVFLGLRFYFLIQYRNAFFEDIQL